MALPAQKPSRPNQPEPGQVRGPKSLNTDYAYLNKDGEEAANDSSYGAANDSTYGRSSQDTVDQTYSKNAFSDKVLGPIGIGNLKNSRKRKVGNESEEETKGRDISRFSKTVQRRLASNNLISPARLLLKARASTVNTSALSWQVPLWLFLQLPFAIMSVIAMGVVAAVDNITSGEGGILSWIASKALKAADTIAKTFGIDFSHIALDLWLMTMVFVLAVGLLSMLFMCLFYLMSGMRPLSGEGAGLKIGMFLLAIIGYSTPLLNMFPFIILWMVAVWWYPR
jgi:hypothetical protein